LVFFLLISYIYSENQKDNSLPKKANEEADNNKEEKSSENKMENKSIKREGRIKNENNLKEIPKKLDKNEKKEDEDENNSENKPKHLNVAQNKERKNEENNSEDKPKHLNASQNKEKKDEDENSSEDKPKHLNVAHNKEKKDEENNSKEKPEDSKEEQDKYKKKEETTKHKKNDEDEEEDDNKKVNKLKKKKDNEDEEDNNENKKKIKTKKVSEEDKKDEDENKEQKKSNKKKIKMKNDNKEDDDKKEGRVKKEENENKKEKGEKEEKKIVNKRCEAILLGFDKYNDDDDEGKISFSIYFVPVYNQLKANILKVPIKINTKETLRSLKEEKQIIECKRRYKNGERQIRYKCEFEKKNRKIERIEVDVFRFRFIGQNVKIKSCSPMAIKNMKNIQDVGKEKQFKNKIYVLEYAELKKNKKNFEIMGRIRDKDFDEEGVNLTILDSKKMEKKVNCKIKKNKGRYIFECEPKEDINGNLDGAYGDIEDKNVVINFKYNKTSKINFVVEKKEEKEEKVEKKKKNDDDDDEKKNENKKKEDNKEKKQEIRRPPRRKKKEDNDDDLQFVYEKNVKIDILIYICIGFIILLLITLAYNCIVQVRNKESSGPYFDNNSMDTVKLSSQSND